jgi:hypothetical protein
MNYTRLILIRLLSIKGDLKDRCQGVYADVVTNSEPSYIRIYIGSATGVYKGHKDSGLSRRIKEHMASITKGSRPESGILHTKELAKAAAKPNFIVLVRFAEEVDLPLIRIAEALMTILFCAWDSQTFHSLRPRALTPIPRNFGLNNANPLTGGFVTPSDLAHPEDFEKHEEHMARCRLVGKRRANENMTRILTNARTGGTVAVTRSSGASKGSYQFAFKALNHKIFVPSDLAKHLGLDITKKVNVVYDISEEGPHHIPYAHRARFQDSSRRLGIKLKGNYARGPMKGLPFEKWLQCKSTKSITTADSIIELIQQPTDSVLRNQISGPREINDRTSIYLPGPQAC